MRNCCLLLLISALLLMAGCTNGESAAANVPVSKTEAPVTVQAAEPTETYVVASGPIVVENQVDVMAQREGVVAKLFADTDTPVKRGQLLAKLDDRQLTAERDAAAAKLRSIEADVKNWESELLLRESDARRSNEMFKASLITQQQVEHDRYIVVQTRYELEREKQNQQQADASLRALQLELEKTSIVAPFSGVVARRYIREGQRLAEGDRTFWVTAIAPLRVRFTLPEKYVGALKRGDVVQVSGNPDFAQKFQARVMQVSPVVDPASGTIEILAELTSVPKELRPGMTASVRFPTPR